MKESQLQHLQNVLFDILDFYLMHNNTFPTFIPYWLQLYKIKDDLTYLQNAAFLASESGASICKRLKNTGSGNRINIISDMLDSELSLPY